MTLIQNFNCGGAVTVMSCDTRQVLNNPIGPPIRLEDAESKVGRISPYCIFGGGGDNYATERIKEELESLSLEFLSDFVKPLQNIINKLKGNVLFRQILQAEGSRVVQILISGFNKDGSSGIITYNSGKKQKVVYKKLEEYKEYPIVISPSYDENEAVFSTLKMDVVDELSELPSNYIGFMSRVQAAFNLNDEQTVSDTFCYCAIYRDPEGEYHCFEDKVGLREEEHLQLQND